MPSIRIQGNELTYDESNIITFEEGLIGMSHLKYMVLVEQTDIAPFLWLVSLDDTRVAFLVVNPLLLFPAYDPLSSDDVRRHLNRFDDKQPTPLAIVKIAAEWHRSTINLRAPLFVSSASMRGMQLPLTESSYRLDEPLPVAEAA